MLACGSTDSNPCAEGTVRAPSGVCETAAESEEEPAIDDATEPQDSGGHSEADTGEAEPEPPSSAAEEAAALAEAAEEFLSSLDADQRDAAQFDLTDAERQAWSNLPVGDYPREGARIGDMTEDQQAKAWALVAMSLSGRGMQRIDEILTMESLVQSLGWGSASLDDYYFVVFDSPSASAPWGWQFDGHHLAMNFTVVGSEVTMTPSLWGVEPSTWDEGEHAGLEPLSEEVERGLAWVNLLSADQRDEAAEGPPGDPDLQFGPQSNPLMWPSVQGLAVADMSDDQRNALTDLIGVYVGNLPVHQAENRMAEIEASLDDASVVWLGDTEPGSAIYYRIHGSRVLIEFDHVMGPNHIHSVYRDPANDYGDDWLSKHLETDHAHDVKQKGLGSWARIRSMD